MMRGVIVTVRSSVVVSLISCTSVVTVGLSLVVVIVLVVVGTRGGGGAVVSITVLAGGMTVVAWGEMRVVL